EDGTTVPFRVRSLVGLIPLYAVERLESQWIAPFSLFKTNLDWFLRFRQDLVEYCVTTIHRGEDYTHVLAVVDQQHLKKLIARVVDPDEFLSPFGLRSMSRFHDQ